MTDWFATAHQCAECRYYEQNHIHRDPGRFYPDVIIPNYCTWREKPIDDMDTASTCKSFLKRLFGRYRHHD